MKKSLLVKSVLVSAFLMASIGGAATAATTTGVELKPSIQVATISKKHVTHSVFFLKNQNIPATYTYSKGEWAGVLDRDSIETVDDGYRAYYSGFVYKEN